MKRLESTLMRIRGEIHSTRGVSFADACQRGLSGRLVRWFDERVNEAVPATLKEEAMTRDGQMPSNGNEHLTTAELARGPVAGNSDEGRTEDKPASLLPDEECNRLRHQWDDIQTSFVDEPRRAVEQADNLVAVSMKRVAEVFADERAKLESQWDRNGNVSTEDLRLALQRYRSFFQRLLTISM